MTQSGRDNEGFQGFVESDLKKEHRRAASLVSKNEPVKVFCRLG